MFTKSFIALLFAAAIIVVGQASTFAQDPIRGVVVLQKADGTTEPVAGAQIDLYRVDMKGGGPSGTTKKNGEFNFVGLLFGGSYAMAVSAPGCAPTIESGIKMGQENIKVTLVPGDGRRWTEAEVRQAVSRQSSSGGDDGPTAEQQKAAADEQKAIEEHNAKVLKAQETNKNINLVLKEGAIALEAKNYDVAVAKFDEGYRADPEAPGSAPVLLTNKGEALRQRGVVAFNSRNTGTDAEKTAALQKAREDFKASMSSFEKALEILEKAPTPTDPAAQKRSADAKLRALRGAVTLQGPFAMASADSAKIAEAIPVLDKYIAAETDDVEELRQITNWAKAMAQSGESKNAIHAYRIILERKPDDIDAMQGLGSALWVEALAVDPPNEAQVQEGINMLQKFIDAAPDGHPMKANAKDTIEAAKETTKLTPKKTTPTKKRG